MMKTPHLVAVAVVCAALFAGPALARDKAFTDGGPADVQKARGLALGHLKQLAAKHGLKDERALEEKRAFVDDLKMAHQHVQQHHEGVPVFGGEAIVHLDAYGDLFAVTDSLHSDVAVDTAPSLTAKDAVDLAVARDGRGHRLTAKPKADLWVVRRGDGDHLAWRVQLRIEDGGHDTALPIFFIDAHNGDTVWTYDNLQTGTGSSLYSGSVTVNSYFRSSNSTYYMEDVTNKLGTFDNRNTPSTNTGAGSTYRYTDANDVWDSTAQRAGVDAHFGALKTYQYFKNVHGRNGIDGSGGPAYYTSIDGVTGLITSKVHYGVSYNNAYWNGSFMTYGDGNGTTFSPLVTLDICGHEMTHGVTERTAGLVYEREPGALNEANSDIFGAMVERYTRGQSANTWLIGEDAYTPGTAGDALRYMDDPHRGGDPDHYSEAQYLNEPTCDPQTNDSCGVHINSGIVNKAFYLMAVGGTHHLSSLTATGIGADVAAAIWYRALTAYMTSTTNFSGARTATLNAATAIHGAGSTQYNAVCRAWAMVGVGSDCAGGGGGGAELVSNGGFEGSASPWVLAANFLHIANGSYPHGGTGYVYNAASNNLSTSAYQQVTIPSTASGSGSFWLNVTSNETTTTTQYDKLFVEVRSTSGTLLATLATYSNLNKGTAGVYSQKTLNLSAYKGQTIRLQFRVTTDSSLTTTFRIDDVSVK